MLGRLDQAFAVQRRFTADASHELRGPLTALRGELDLALKRERSPAEYRETLERCREEVIRLTRLATDLLTLARNEAGLTAQDRTEVDLRQVAERVMERFHGVVEERGLHFVIEGPPAVVRGDPAMLERVVGNLVDNAVKHSPRGGAITIEIHSAEWTGTDCPRSGPRCAPGGSGSTIQSVLSWRHPVPRGASTGLGLAIAKAAAGAHGGRLEFVRNDPGAVFRLVLPPAATRS